MNAKDIKHKLIKLKMQKNSAKWKNKLLINQKTILQYKLHFGNKKLC